MCLGELAEVIELTGPAGAVVAGDNRLRAVSLLTLDGPVTPGDWVVIHSGFALGRLTADEGREARDLRRSGDPTASRRASDDAAGPAGLISALIAGIGDGVGSQADGPPSTPRGAMQLTETSYTDDDFAEVDLTGEALEGITFIDCDFTDAALVDVRTRRVTFERCRFVGTELYGSSHQSSSFLSCTFERAAWHDAALTDCRLIGSSFTDCRLLRLSIRDCDLTLVSLAGANLAGTDLSGLRMREANLVGANLAGCDLRGADLTGARSARLDLTGADLRGARLDAAAFVGAVLRGAVVEIDQAVHFAAAHGLLLGPGDQPSRPRPSKSGW